MKKRLIILHIDGLSYNHLFEAIEKGYMPTVKRLLEKEGYNAWKYRTGIPSTTPFAQAGILYGDNTNIPSFTWFDKESGVVVRFGSRPSFQKVSHKYFKNKTPLTEHGASIATCYPAGASETFALAYNDPKSPTKTKAEARRSVLLRWFCNPFYVAEWIFFSVFVFVAYFIKLVQININGEHVSYKYFITELLQEIFLHHMTRYAAAEAMKDGYPVIYAAFYAYDDGAHAFGPENKFCLQMLGQLDRSMHYINEKREKNKHLYELLILSDHGQISTQPFKDRRHKQLGDILAEWLPNYDIQETPGKHIESIHDRQDGEIMITYSGGLGHLYFRQYQGRADMDAIHKGFPGLIDNIKNMPEIGCMLMKKGKEDVLIMKEKVFILSHTNKELLRYLSTFDDAEILLEQLKKFNSFMNCGDIVFFGAFINGKQINFENQQGGHGTFGSEQMHPFIMLKDEWNIKVENVTNATQLHPLIQKLISKFA